MPNATPLLDLLSRPPDNAFPRIVKSYPFDHLKPASAGEAALLEAAKADPATNSSAPHSPHLIKARD